MSRGPIIEPRRIRLQSRHIDLAWNMVLTQATVEGLQDQVEPQVNRSSITAQAGSTGVYWSRVHHAGCNDFISNVMGRERRTFKEQCVCVGSVKGAQLVECLRAFSFCDLNPRGKAVQLQYSEWCFLSTKRGGERRVGCGGIVASWHRVIVHGLHRFVVTS